MKKYIIPFVIMTICFFVFEVNDSDKEAVVKANTTTRTTTNYQVAHNKATISDYSYSEDDENDLDNMKIAEIR